MAGCSRNGGSEPLHVKLTDRDVFPLFVCRLENSFKNCVMNTDVSGQCYFAVHASIALDIVRVSD